MAASSRGSHASVIEALSATPERFEFVRAVRVLERAAEIAAGDLRSGGQRRLGMDNDPRHEAVFLRAAMELTFPATEVAAFGEANGRPELAVTLMGLNGPSGVLPGFYSQLVLEGQRDKNLALRDFLDMFNHRALSFFARAAEKYRLALTYERSGGATSDPIGAVIYALIGLGEPSLLGRQAAPDTAQVFYAGHFAHRPRTAAALAQLLTEYFEQPMTISQFVGHWASLSAAEQTQLAAAAGFSQLGVNAIAGSRVFDVQGKFRVGLGPLEYKQFIDLLPGRARLAELVALTRSYAGPALSFDVQLTLKASEIPPLQLSADAAPRLGWNCWLPTSGERADATDAIFEVEEI